MQTVPTYHQRLRNLPDAPQKDLQEEVQKAFACRFDQLLVIDPDGRATVAGIGQLILMDNQTEHLEAAFQSAYRTIFLKLNLRLLDTVQREEYFYLLGQRIKQVSARNDKSILVVMCLPANIQEEFELFALEALELGLGQLHSSLFFCPTQLEQGYVTIENTLFNTQNKGSFGKHSLMPPLPLLTLFQQKGIAHAIGSISIPQLRTTSENVMSMQLQEYEQEEITIVNTANYFDIQQFALSILNHKSYPLCAIDISLLRVLNSQYQQAWVTLKNTTPATKVKNGGLLVIGSYRPMATRQLEALENIPNAQKVELPVRQLLDPQTVTDTCMLLSEKIGDLLKAKQHVVLYTSRTLVLSGDPLLNAQVGRQVLQSITQLLKAIPVIPAFLIVKGRKTSDTIIKDVLQLRSATVAGQLLPEAPLWICGPDSRIPGLPFIPITGRAGTDNALQLLLHNA